MQKTLGPRCCNPCYPKSLCCLWQLSFFNLHDPEEYYVFIFLELDSCAQRNSIFSSLWTVEEEALLSTGSSVHTRKVIFLFLSLEILEYVHLGRKVQAALCHIWSAFLICVFLRNALVILYLQMLQNLKLKLLETSHDYVTENSGNPVPMSIACSRLRKKNPTVIHSQCSAENSWDQTFVSFHLLGFFYEITNFWSTMLYWDLNFQK